MGKSNGSDSAPFSSSVRAYRDLLWWKWRTVRAITLAPSTQNHWCLVLCLSTPCAPCGKLLVISFSSHHLAQCLSEALRALECSRLRPAKAENEDLAVALGNMWDHFWHVILVLALHFWCYFYSTTPRRCRTPFIPDFIPFRTFSVTTFFFDVAL